MAYSNYLVMKNGELVDFASYKHKKNVIDYVLVLIYKYLHAIVLCTAVALTTVNL